MCNRNHVATIAQALMLAGLAVPVHAQSRSAPAPAAEHAAPSTAGTLPPDVILLADLQKLYQPVPFDHAAHVRMAAMSTGCTACHHHTPAGSEHAACRTCHSTASVRDSLGMPGLKGAYHRQCLSCHREWSGQNGCSACHEPKTGNGKACERDSTLPSAAAILASMPTPTPPERYVYQTGLATLPVVTFHHDDHAKSYGVQCVDCHRGDSCSRCHAASSPRTASAAHRRAGELKSQCIQCHGESNCSMCHDQAPRSRFDHAVRAGWPLEPNHAGVQCRECHGPAREFAVPSKSCHGCHSRVRASAAIESQGHAMPPVTADEMRCLSCHLSVCDRIEQASTVHAPASSEKGCVKCHDMASAGSPRPAREHQQALCLGCHDRTIESKSGRSIVNIAAQLAENPNLHGPVREGNCSACHNPHAGENAHLLVRGYSDEFYASFRLDRYALCFGCHDQRKIMSESADGLTGFRDGDRNLHWLHVNREKGRTCRVCHEVHASKRPFHIRESVPFSGSGWQLPINFEQSPAGGSCAPGCHAPKSYDRTRAGQQAMQTGRNPT